MDTNRTRGSGAHFVYLELKRRILELELEPGSRLKEPALAADLSVSRTPLREAVRRLIAENLLEQQPTGGVVVPKMDEKGIAELYDVRAALEALMAGAACKKVTEDDLAVLGELVDRNAALVNFAEDALEAGKSVHAKIAEVADNAWASRLHEQVSNQMQRYRMYTNHSQARREQALADHRAIVEALRAGDPSHASALAFNHVISARDEAIRAISGRIAT
jgi:DNA-binding GntR family transcriptional regulator